MSKTDLVNFIAEETGLTKADSSRALEAVMNGIIKGLKEEKKVALTGFCTFNAKEKEAFNKSLDRVYADFTQKVSQRRGFDDKKINEVARGRVWLGKDAYELGLVDAIGGIDMALFKAKELAQIKLGEEFSLEYYPRKQSFSEKLTKYIENGGGLPAMKVMQKYGIEPTDLNIIYRLKFDTVMPPFKVSM